MSTLWIALAALVAAVGIARRARMLRDRRESGAALDDQAIRRIVEEGSLPYDPDDEPLDLEEAARAEEEFWSEEWDDPEEFHP